MISERKAQEVLRHVNEIAKFARASGRCEDGVFAAHLDEHDRYAHEEMQAIRALLGLAPRKRRYKLPD